MGFDIALKNVLLTLIYIIPGYLLCKFRKVKDDHLSSISAILIYVLAPCMIVSSFLKLDYSIENIKKMGLFFATSLLLQCCFMAILYFLFRKKYDNSKYRLITIGSVLGNVGFFGLPIIKALFPEDPIVMCYSAVFVISMNVLVFTMGIFCLTNDYKYMKIKSVFLNPSSLTLLIALPLYILKDKFTLPILISDAVSLLGNMTTPICMFILGIRLATMPLKKVFMNWFIYLIIGFKLIVFPIFCYLCVLYIPFFDDTFKISILILSGTPCASVILNMAEIYHSEEEMSANCVLLSTMLCFITIPLLTLLT